MRGKMSTESPLAQSSNGTPHTLNHTTPSLPFLKKFRRYKRLVFSISVTPSQIIASDISKSPQVRFLLAWLRLNYFPVHQPAVTNSMHLLSTNNPNLQHLQSEAHLDYSQTSARVETVGYFGGRAPSWMFDKTLNATLPNNLLELEESLRRNFPSLGLQKGISDYPYLLILLIHTITVR